MDSREIIRQLRKAGWRRVRQKGSHIQLRHPALGRLVTVPHPRKDLPRGTVKSIERQTGLELR